MTKLVCDIDLICKHKLACAILAISIFIISMISGFIFVHYAQKKENDNDYSLIEKMMAVGRGTFAVSGKSST